MPINFKAWHDQTAAQHKQKADDFFKQGFRTVSLCVYGEPKDPLYAAVMVKRPKLVDEKQFIALSIDEMKQKIDELSKKGFGAAIISATGPANSPLIAAVFRPMKQIPLTRGNLTADDLAKDNVQAWKDGNILKWADAYGTPDDTRYMAVWQRNTDFAAWNCDAVNEDAQTMQQRFNAFQSGWSRLQHVAITPSQGFLGVFVDTDIGPTFSYGNMTSAGFQAKKDEFEKQGFAPICVAAQGSGADARFAAVFVSREEIAPRGDITILPKDEPTVPKIDDIIKDVMIRNLIRGAAVAVVKGTRLVYAKGYTWAEEGYPKVTPTTVFRQASVSKFFASIATYQLIQEGKMVDGKKFSLDTTMQSVLKLKTPTGGKPTDENFDKITIRHLLEMTSGIGKLLLFSDLKAIKSFNPPESLPAKPKHVAAFCASQKLDGVPGDKAIAYYNNGGYFMLSQVIAAMRGASSFEEAIKASLLKPLGIKRVRESRTLVSAQPADEARYHSTVEFGLFPRISTANSIMTPEQPLVALGYGDTNFENVDGAGGLSGAVTDVARVLAALNMQKKNPMLDDAMVKTMLANAAAASADKQLTHDSQGNWKASGFHGFDWVVTLDASKGMYLGRKSGDYYTSENGIGFLRGDMAYVFCWNCKTPNTDDKWIDKFWIEINKHDWGNTDLFEKYDMSPFPASSGSLADAAAMSKPGVKLPSLAMPKSIVGSIAPPPKLR